MAFLCPQLDSLPIIQQRGQIVNTFFESFYRFVKVLSISRIFTKLNMQFCAFFTTSRSIIQIYHPKNSVISILLFSADTRIYKYNVGFFITQAYYEFYFNIRLNLLTLARMNDIMC